MQSNILTEALHKIITIGLTDNDKYCRCCGTWLKAKNDLDSHDKAFACGIAVSALKQYSRRDPDNNSNTNLIDKLANRLSGMDSETWEVWKAMPYKTKSLPNTHSPESLKNEAIEILNLIENSK
jgi:hypothetical protein